jgi:hypothetical protein
MAHVLAWVTLGLTMLLDVAATVLVVRSDIPTPIQKAIQLVFTWAVPVVGSIIVIAVLKETTAPRSTRLESGADKEWLPGMGPESEASGSHHGHHVGGDVGHGGDGGFGGGGDL